MGRPAGRPQPVLRQVPCACVFSRPLRPSQAQLPKHLPHGGRVRRRHHAQTQGQDGDDGRGALRERAALQVS